MYCLLFLIGYEPKITWGKPGNEPEEDNIPRYDANEHKIEQWLGMFESFITVRGLEGPVQANWDELKVKDKDWLDRVDKVERKVWSWLYIKLDDAHKTFIEAFKPVGSKAWNALKDRYKLSSPMHRIEMEKELHNITLEAFDDNINEYLSRINTLVRLINKIEENAIKPAAQAHITLRGLNPEIQQILLLNDEKLDKDKLETQLRNLSNFNRRNTKKEKESIFNTNDKRNYRQNKEPKQLNFNQRKDYNKERSITCYNCGGRGHKRAECPSKIMNNEKQNNSQRTTKNNYLNNSKKEWKQRNNNNFNRNNNNDKVNYANEEQETDITRLYINTLELKEDQVLIAKETDEDNWILDSGASMHVCNDPEKFIKLDNRIKKEIEVANQQVIVSSGRGDIEIKVDFKSKVTDKKEKVATIELKDVLYVPKSGKNLISMSKLMEDGYNFRIKDSDSKGYFGNYKDYYLPIYKENKLLIVKEKNSPDRITSNSNRKQTNKQNCDTIATARGKPSTTTNTSQSDNSLLLAHIRTGHSGMKMLTKLQGSVNGLKVKPINGYINCEVCLESKMAREKFIPNERKDLEPFKIVHSDILGPLQPSMGGRQIYVIGFVCRATRHLTIYEMTKKSDAFEKFKLFKAEVVDRSKHKIRVLRADNGGEYTSNRMM